MLRARLFLNLLPFVVILLAIGLYAIVLFSRLANAVDTTVTEDYRSLMAAQAMSLALAGMDREIWMAAGRMNAPNPALTENQKQFEQNLATQLKSAPLPDEAELNQQLAGEYHALQQSLAKLSSLTNAAAQHQVYDREIVPTVLRLNAYLEKVRDLNHQTILATSQNTQKITAEITRLML